MAKLLKKNLLSELGLEEIGIQEMDLSACIVSKCGGHGVDSIQHTLSKKMNDIKNVGHCMWAHGNLNSKHTRKFCIEWSEKINGSVYVIMPYTLSNCTVSTGGNVFKKYIVDDLERTLPNNMNEVTGPHGSRAFVFDKLFYLKENFNVKEFYSGFWAVNCDDSVKSAEVSLAHSCSNKCLRKKEGTNVNMIEMSVTDESGIIVGRLAEPYHVILKEDCN